MANSLTNRPQFLPSPENTYPATVNLLREAMAKTNLAEFQAQIHEANMIEIVAGFAYDVTLDPPFRKACAESVVDRARGAVVRTTRSIIEAAPAGDQRDPLAAIEAARTSIAKMRELQDWMNSGKPRELWPEHVRALIEQPAFADGEESGS